MADRLNGMIQSYGYPSTPSSTNDNPTTPAVTASSTTPINPLPHGLTRTVAAAAANNHHSSRGKAGRNSKRYSVSAFYSMAAEQDNEVEDELAQAQRRLRELKSKISGQSKKNFVLERDVRYLDSRIALLIQNRIALSEQTEMASHLEEHGAGDDDVYPDDRKLQQYGNLLFILQSEPRHIATLCRLVSLAEIDTLLQTVMFTLYGNQYESREEHLLLTMFQNVLAAQFETSTEFGSLLRANTPVSRMMTTYTRRGPGQSYLKTTLAEKISSLVEHKDLNLEINPLKVYEQMVAQIEQDSGSLPQDIPKSVTPEIAANNADVQAIIQPRLKMLMEVAESFLNTIISSVNDVPYGIRWICKQIRSLTKRKNPQASEFSVCSMIGGFFFLRFINPAIVTPRAYMLLDNAPGKYPRRTLTLIAKMLQNLANRPSYAKEAYMLPTNPFVEDNKSKINKFLNELCEVSDFYESLEMDQYMALSKKDILLNISLNEIFNTLTLVQKHIDVIAPKDKDRIRILMVEMGQAPAQVARKDNKTIDLPLFSRWEIPIQDLTTALMSENNITQNDILYMETKAIYVQLIRSLPHLSHTGALGLDLDYIAETAATAKDAQLVRKGIKVKDMLRELEDMGIIDHQDRYKLLVEEITQELTHLGNLKEKVLLELASLESVYKTILDHNTYLRGQLESYKAYLQNVRISGAEKQTKKSVGLGVQVGDTTLHTGGYAGHTNKKKGSGIQGPFKFSHSQLEKDGVISQSTVPESRRPNIYFAFTSPLPGTFVIAMHFKGREKAILEMDLKLDDLLEKQQDNVELLDLEYVGLNVSKTLQLLNKTFVTRNNQFMSQPTPLATQQEQQSSVPTPLSSHQQASPQPSNASPTINHTQVAPASEQHKEMVSTTTPAPPPPPSSSRPTHIKSKHGFLSLLLCCTSDGPSAPDGHSTTPTPTKRKKQHWYDRWLHTKQQEPTHRTIEMAQVMPPPPVVDKPPAPPTNPSPSPPSERIVENVAWLLPPVASEHVGRKCLVLDLDETLVHSSFKIIPNPDFVVPVEIDQQVHNVYVLKRPGVDEFMRKMGEIYEIVVFTASLSKYADPVLDMLDKHQVVKHRLFRESCFNHKGSYVKDLSQLGRDLATTMILDNSPTSYLFHISNAVPVSTWFNDPHDTELTDLVDFLDDLTFVDDVTLILDSAIDPTSAQ